MTVSERDKAKMRRIAKDFKAAETDDLGTPEERRRFLTMANALRAKDGLPPFPDEDEERPELGLNRRARALGMARTNR